MAAYAGPEITLDRFLIEPAHSLYRQSWDAREALEARVNADGYGFAWYAGAQPLLYRLPVPVWTDGNLPALARSMRSRIWLGNMRSATPGLGIHALNTQPFADDRWVFSHNGRLANFARHWRGSIRAAISADVEASIGGNTDSEYLFALVREARNSGAPVEEALPQVLSQLSAWHAAGEVQGEALLTLILTDGSGLYAARHAIGAKCPTLYFSVDHPAFPQAAIVASERFDKADGWREIPPHHLVSLLPGRPPKLQPL
jgi:glutamine amidotransferase